MHPRESPSAISISTEFVLTQLDAQTKSFSTETPLRNTASRRPDVGNGCTQRHAHSFSDGGKFFDLKRAIAQALAMQRDGADIIDIGAESTRPGAREISAAEELTRLLPVLEGLRGKLKIP